MTHQQLIQDIQTFMAAKGMAPSTFGRKAMNDWRFYFELEAGKRELLPRTERKVRTFMAGYGG